MNDGEGRPADFQFAFGHERSAPRSVRAVLRPLFDDEDDLGVDVTMVASELVSNVIEHTEDGGTLRAWFDRSATRIEVTDAGVRGWSAVPTSPDGAHGLEIVAALAARWGVESTERGGQCVWAELDGARSG